MEFVDKKNLEEEDVSDKYREDWADTPTSAVTPAVDEAQQRKQQALELEQTTTDDEEEEIRSWWQGNWNPIWVVGTAYLLLFISYMGLAEFGHAYAGFIIHTLLALSFVLACAWNLFHTPSHGDCYRTIHKWTGWIVMWSGFFVVLSGYIIVLNGRSSLSSTAENLFMATGAFQLVVQVFLVYAIRYSNWNSSVWYHMFFACMLFFACALMPAVNRAPQMFGFPDSDTFTFAILPFGFCVLFFAICFYTPKA